MIIKIDPEVFNKISHYAPGKHAIHILISRSRKSGAQEKWLAMWKEWRFHGSNAEEIIEKLKIFKLYQFPKI